MGVLAEYLKTEAEQLRKELQKRGEAVREWEAAVYQLYDQLEQWVRDADAGAGLLTVGRWPRPTFQEPRLGVYELDCLQIALGASSRRAEVRPRARHVVASIRPPGRDERRADGTVELRDGGLAVDYLFRLKEDGGDVWYIQSHARWHGDMLNNDVEELTAERFETALLRVLQ